MEVLTAVIIAFFAVLFGAIGWFSAPAEMAWVALFGFAIVLTLIAIVAAIDTK